MDKRSVLTSDEAEAMLSLWNSWQIARNEKRWDDADVLRKQVVDAGMSLDNPSWHPVFESSSHRQMRLNARS